MPLDELISQPITGIEPFNELPIDADIWREAHGQHNLHRRLHAVGTHRPGIVYGLEVVVSKAKEKTVVVAPGMGVDAEGRALILSEPQTFTLEEKGETFITISYDEGFDRKSGISVGGGQKYFRLVEGRQVAATRELPKGPYLELGRIDRTGAAKAVKEASNPFDPAEDELNLMHRSSAFPQCYADGEIADLCFLPKSDSANWKPNRAGLWNLVREANGRGFHLEFSGLYNLRAAPTGSTPFLLYVAGEGEFQALADQQIEGLRKFLDSGGVLFAEASKGSEEFIKSFKDLAKKIGANPAKLAKGHTLLTAHHVFPSAPSGAKDGGAVMIDADRGVILSTADYGGAWQGDIAKPDAADAREKVRSAQEFGLNIVAFAAKRRRQAYLATLV